MEQQIDQHTKANQSTVIAMLLYEETMPLHMHLRISLIQRPDEECQEFVYDSMKVFLNVFEAVSRGLHFPSLTGGRPRSRRVSERKQNRKDHPRVSHSD